MRTLTEEEWKACLAVDPFSGDFGDGEITLSDKKVKAAKLHEKKCGICYGNIEKGEYHRAFAWIYDGEARTTRFCSECCYALAISNEDNGRLWESRVNLFYTKVPLSLTKEMRVYEDVEPQPGPDFLLLLDIQKELKRAREKFPGKNVTFAAMVEEVGELATALFEENKDRVRQEAVQVAVMAMRVVLDGDHTFDNWREEKGLDKL